MSIRILLADDHQIVRAGLKNLLDKHKDIEIVGEAADGRETVAQALKIEPDVVVMDIAMPGLNGMEATRQIIEENPNIRIIALSMHSDRQYVSGMFQSGASGYLLKDCAADELVDAVRTVFGRQIYLSKEITGVVVKEMVSLRKRGLGPESDLSDREREVLQLLAEGKSTREIAEILFISIKTVETHRQKIMAKLEIYTLPELTKYAIRAGLTSVEN